MTEIATLSAQALGDGITLFYSMGIIVIFLLAVLVGMELFK